MSQNLLIDAYCWYYLFLCYLYLVTLMNFEGVLCIYLLLFEGQADCHYAMFSICETNKRFSMHVIDDLCFNLSCCMHSYYVLLLELHLSCTCLEFVDPIFQCLQMVGSLLWGCMSPQKLFFYHLPTRGRAGVKLGDAWYVGNVSIIFDVPCLFSIYFALLCLHFEVFLYIFWN